MYTVVEEKCDICGHECVALMPVKQIGQGNECGECGNMSLYPKEEAEPLKEFQA